MELLSRTCNTETMNAQRIFARTFVIIGAVFWTAMIWGERYAYAGAPVSEALANAAIAAVGIGLIFVLGLFYENLAAAVLLVAAAVLVGYGVFVGWESGVWGVMLFFFIMPMVVGAVLYLLAARMQRICELS